MPFGLDSRSAMVPGGAAEGFGNLGAALLMAPQMRRKLDQQAAAEQADRDFRERQLADAIAGRAAAQTLDRDRFNEEKRWHDQQNTARWAEDLGSGANNAAKRLTEAMKGMGLGGESHGRAPVDSLDKIETWKPVETVTPEGKIIRDRVPLTNEEMDAQLALRDRARGRDLHRAVNGQAPAAPASASVQANLDRNRAYRGAMGMPEPRAAAPAPQQQAAPNAPAMGQPPSPAPPAVPRGGNGRPWKQRNMTMQEEIGYSALKPEEVATFAKVMRTGDDGLIEGMHAKLRAMTMTDPYNPTGPTPLPLLGPPSAP